MATQGKALLIVLCVTGGLLLLAALLWPTLHYAPTARGVRPGIPTDQFEERGRGQVRGDMVAPKSAEPGPPTIVDGWDKLDGPIEDMRTAPRVVTKLPPSPEEGAAVDMVRPREPTSKWVPPNVDPPSNTPVFGPETGKPLARGIYSGRARTGQRGGSPGGSPGTKRYAIGGSGERRPGRPVAWAGEELWVIVPSEEQAKPVGPQYDTPGTGSMMAKLPSEQKEVPVPLKHTDVKASIAGYIATVEVTQKFHNPYSVKIEAVYVFPLPQNAAVNEFLMTVGERRIRGIIRERQEAERIYLEARRQGHVVSLLTQERPNIFTQRVANIEPGKAIDVNILYFNTLSYADGWYEFRFPMVVGPRFNPPGSAEGVGAVARGGQGISGQKTEVQYLHPTERSGHDIALSVDVDAGVGIEELKSVNHAITKSLPTAEKASVSLSQLDSVPNKDFVLRYRVAGKTLKSAVMAHRDKRGGFFTLMLYPPADTAQVERSPMEFVFVLDRSGSMSGKPIEQAKKAIERGLRNLQPGDTFQLIWFSDRMDRLTETPIAATPENVQRAIQTLGTIQGSGGTMMIQGITAALRFNYQPKGVRYIAFLTDGFIGNEEEILTEVQKSLGVSRIFSFGVGASPNGYLLDSLARLGKGCVAYLSLNDDGGEVMDRFFERASHPALTDIEVNWGGMQVADVYPKRVPDLYVGRPVILTGRFTGGDANTTVRVRGRSAGETRERAIAVALDAAEHKGIPFVWARTRIEELSDLALGGQDKDAPEQIKRLALDFNLMSAYTSFVAVDSLTKTAGDHGVSVAVPVPVPDGVRYDTTVQER